MKPSRFFNLAFALLALTGAGFWVHHNIRREVAPLNPRPSPAASATTSLPAPDDTSRPLDKRASPAGPSLGAVLAATNDAPRVMAGLSQIILDSTRTLDERAEALDHMLNLSVNDPSAALLPLIADTRLTNEHCTRILDDSLNGSPAWQADANLAVLAHRKDPDSRASAREHLVFLLEVDHGEDLARWAAAIAAAKKDWVATI